MNDNKKPGALRMPALHQWRLGGGPVM